MPLAIWCWLRLDPLTISAQNLRLWWCVHRLWAVCFPSHRCVSLRINAGWSGNWRTERKTHGPYLTCCSQRFIAWLLTWLGHRCCISWVWKETSLLQSCDIASEIDTIYREGPYIALITKKWAIKFSLSMSAASSDYGQHITRVSFRSSRKLWESRRCGVVILECQFCCLLALWPCASHLISLKLTLLPNLYDGELHAYFLRGLEIR